MQQLGEAPEQPPQTWEHLLDLVARANGTDIRGDGQKVGLSSHAYTC